MLWKYLRPELVRWDYTKLDAMKLIEKAHNDGECGFYCDREKGVMLRVNVVNPKTIIVDIHGNGLAIRGALEEAMSRVFVEYKFDIVELWLIDDRFVRICSAAGFKVVAHVANRMYVDGKMLDITVMHYTRRDYEDEFAKQYRSRTSPTDGLPADAGQEAA